MTSWFSEFGSLTLHRTGDNSDDDVYDGYNDDGNQEDDCDFQNLALFLFTDLLVVAKRKSEERFVVLDYSPRNMIQVMRRKKCYSAFQSDENDVLWHQPYIMIIFKVSELESSEGVPGLGGGDQAGFALWLTLLQVSFWLSQYFIIFALWQAFFSLSYILCMVIMLCWWIKWTIATNSTVKVKVMMTWQVKIQFQLIITISYC